MSRSPPPPPPFLFFETSNILKQPCRFGYGERGEEKEGERGRNRERDRGGEIGRDKEEESRRRGEDRLYCFLRAKKKEREGGEEREDLPVEYCITFHRSAGSVIRSFLLQTFTLLSLLPWPGKALIASH